MTSDRGNTGFTLLEVLVAFAIAAVALGVLFQGTIGGLRGAAVANRTSEAVTRAKSHLAAFAAPGALVAGDRDGDDGSGYHWRTHVTKVAGFVPRPADPQLAVGPPPPETTLYAISVAISWRGEGHDRVVQLDSARLGTVARPQ